MMLTWP